MAISALGERGTYPSASPTDYGLIDESDNPASTLYPSRYMASFTNIGPEISLVGAGCSIVSTVPGDQKGNFFALKAVN